MFAEKLFCNQPTNQPQTALSHLYARFFFFVGTGFELSTLPVEPLRQPLLGS
jgi:hypothetical protein